MCIRKLLGLYPPPKQRRYFYKVIRLLADGTYRPVFGYSRYEAGKWYRARRCGTLKRLSLSYEPCFHVYGCQEDAYRMQNQYYYIKNLVVIKVECRELITFGRDNLIRIAFGFKEQRIVE